MTEQTLDLQALLKSAGGLDALKKAIAAEDARQKAAAKAAVEAEVGLRTTAAEAVRAALEAVSETLPFPIVGEVKRTETGFDDYVMRPAPSVMDAIRDQVLEALELGCQGAEDVKSLRGFTFEAGPETITTASPLVKGHSATGTSGGGGGKGWAKDGIVRKLGDIWAEFATPEQIAEYEALKGNGTKQWTLRKTVATAQGYVENK